MRETLLLIGHGSRDPDGNQEVEQFAEEWRRLRPSDRVEVCFIEFAQVLVPEGLDRAAREADRVVVVPLILNAAGHVKREIPAFLTAARRRHPDVVFLAARHLGAEDALLRMLRMRLHSAMVAMDMPDPRSSGVVLLGRGSSDPEANASVAQMARLLFESTDHELVDYAFTGITYPRLESVVQRQIRLGVGQLLVVPYYLFTGRLVKRIHRQVARLRGQYPGCAIGLADYLGGGEPLRKLVAARVQEVREGGASRLICDGCPYPDWAPVAFGEEGDHDHHHEEG